MKHYREQLNPATVARTREYDTHFQYDFTMNRQETYDAGMQVVLAFLKENEIPKPKFTVGVAPHTFNKWQTYGLYLPDSQGTPRIYVNVDMATKPTRTRGRIWSFPGHKTDRTAAGILAHETGHHVSAFIAGHLGERELVVGQYLPWRAVQEKSKPITSYAPTPEEEFAETMRLFILNPDLLRLGRSTRYEFLIKGLELKPVVKLHWHQVLKNAPDFIQHAAEKFTTGGK